MLLVRSISDIMCLTASVIIPVYNEEKYILNCIESLLNQTFPKDDMEILFIDGNSDDHTVSIIHSFSEKNQNFIKVINNPNRTQAYAMNIGIREAKGKYIIRMDAHADYQKDYIQECVKILNTGEYDNVGGIAETHAKSEYGEIVALMMSSRFGVGNSQFRTSNVGGLVDTVPFGAFRKDYLEKIGGFDVRLDRNEDNEINYRIRSNGGKIYLSPTIRFTYYCRESLNGILQMAFQNGKWTIIASKYCPGSMSIRHIIPLAFVVSLFGMGIGGLFLPSLRFLLTLELSLYVILDLLFSIKATKRIKQLSQLAPLFFLFHFTYGLGSLYGVFYLFKNGG